MAAGSGAGQPFGVRESGPPRMDVCRRRLRDRPGWFCLFAMGSVATDRCVSQQYGGLAGERSTGHGSGGECFLHSGTESTRYYLSAQPTVVKSEEVKPSEVKPSEVKPGFVTETPDPDKAFIASSPRPRNLLCCPWPQCPVAERVICDWLSAISAAAWALVIPPKPRSCCGRRCASRTRLRPFCCPIYM